MDSLTDAKRALRRLLTGVPLPIPSHERQVLTPDNYSYTRPAAANQTPDVIRPRKMGPVGFKPRKNPLMTLEQRRLVTELTNHLNQTGVVKKGATELEIAETIVEVHEKFFRNFSEELEATQSALNQALGALSAYMVSREPDEHLRTIQRILAGALGGAEQAETAEQAVENLINGR